MGYFDIVVTIQRGCKESDVLKFAEDFKSVVNVPYMLDRDGIMGTGISVVYKDVSTDNLWDKFERIYDFIDYSQRTHPLSIALIQYYYMCKDGKKHSVQPELAAQLMIDINEYANGINDAIGAGCGRDEATLKFLDKQEEIMKLIKTNLANVEFMMEDVDSDIVAYAESFTSLAVTASYR